MKKIKIPKNVSSDAKQALVHLNRLIEEYKRDNTDLLFDAYEKAVEKHPRWRHEFYALCDKRRVDCSKYKTYMKTIKDFLQSKNWPVPETGL